MKIAIVHDFLTTFGGAERVLIEIHKIFPDAPIYTLLYDQKGTKNIFSDKEFDIRTSKLQRLPKSIRTRKKLLLNNFPKAIEQLDLKEYDIVISSSNSYAHGVKTSKNTLHITYCYSPMRFVWDWYHQYLSENNIGFGAFGVKVRSMLSNLRVWDYEVSSRTDCWVAISKTVAGRIKKYYRKDSKIIFPPVDIKNIYAGKVETKDYYLIVSRLSAYKSIDLVVKAFNKNMKKLIIIGEGSDKERLMNMAKNNIDFLGFKDDDFIKKSYAECKAFIFPGEDDFGITPIEAMAAGKPVIAFRKGGTTETIIDNITGVFFDKQDEKTLNQAIDYFEKNISKFTAENCLKQAEKFSAEKFRILFKNCVMSSYNEKLITLK